MFQKDDIEALANQKGASKLDTFTRQNFVYGLNKANKETDFLGIVCKSEDTTKAQSVIEEKLL
jgi:hypothetical protein